MIKIARQQICNVVNLALSMINLLIATLVLGGFAMPDKYKDRKVPLLVNVILLVLLVSILAVFLSRGGDSQPKNFNLSDSGIAAAGNRNCATGLCYIHKIQQPFYKVM